MAHDDLRTFLDALAKHGQLLHVGEEVDPDVDLTAAATAAARMGDRAPALHFDRLRGFTDARVAMNVHGSWANHAIAMGLPPDTSARDQVTEFARRWADFPVPVERRADPPFLENTLTGDDVNLFQVLPLFRLNDADGGFYLDKAAVVSRDPADPEHFGKQNVGIYRLQVKGRNRLGMQPGSIHDIAGHLRHAEERGADLPVAIAVGTDPITSIVAATPMRYDDSEYEMAGALRGSPAPVATAPLTGLDVPWGTEVLLEGVIEGRVREIEGPFGEFTGHYSGGRRMAVVRIDRISYRSQPVFEHLHLGMPWTEIDYLMGPATCVPLLAALRADFPEVRAVNAMYTHGLLVIVSTAARYGGFAKAVGLRAMTTAHGLGYCKVVIVVDAEVDPFDLPQVMWALSTKVNGPDDVVNVPAMSILPLDPGADPPGISNKLLIDATTPVAPDARGRHGHPVRDSPEVGRWARRLRDGDASGDAEVRPERPARRSAECPRCGTSEPLDVASSSVPGAWDVQMCTRCWYGWRTTEPEHRTRPDAFPESLRWSAEKIDQAPVLPPLPPLRRD
ncbi:non-oxidative hydroxyarylic acid decarboxylases subunit C [Micromonospora sp. NPDC005215]|uniref:non-oxidative hydroxyarylic acid decarboxylases subunit C n=1 Tax=Micromonospora sp. NPDC005215 TaxID=3157024 RepID=UPI0033ADFCA7